MGANRRGMDISCHLPGCSTSPISWSVLMGPIGERNPYYIQIFKSKLRWPLNFPIFCFGAEVKFLGYVCWIINLDIQNGSPGIYLIALHQFFELCWNEMPKASGRFFSFLPTWWYGCICRWHAYHACDGKQAQTESQSQILQHFHDESGFTKRVADCSYKQVHRWTEPAQDKSWTEPSRSR